MLVSWVLSNTALSTGIPTSHQKPTTAIMQTTVHAATHKHADIAKFSIRHKVRHVIGIL